MLNKYEIIKELNHHNFPATILENYYDIIKELITALLYINGLKTTGEGAHIETIDFLKIHKEFSEHELIILQELRIKRHGSQYYGKIPPPEFLTQNEAIFKEVINKLKSILSPKI